MLARVDGRPEAWVEWVDDGAAPDFFWEYEQRGMRILLAARWCRRRDDPQPSWHAWVITSQNEIQRDGAGLCDAVAEIIGDVSLPDEPALVGGEVPSVLGPIGEGNGIDS